MSEWAPVRIGSAEAPWEGTVYGLVFKPIIDNGEVLQRWQLYQQPGAGSDGQVESTVRAREDAELVHAWSTGGKTLDFREHGSVGLELPSTTYRLELYYDSADPSALDASGVELCYVRDKPEHVAGISWLGVPLMGSWLRVAQLPDRPKPSSRTMFTAWLRRGEWDDGLFRTLMLLIPGSPVPGTGRTSTSSPARRITSGSASTSREARRRSTRPSSRARTLAMCWASTRLSPNPPTSSGCTSTAARARRAMP